MDFGEPVNLVELLRAYLITSAAQPVGLWFHYADLCITHAQETDWLVENDPDSNMTQLKYILWIVRVIFTFEMQVSVLAIYYDDKPNDG